MNTKYVVRWFGVVCLSFVVASFLRVVDFHTTFAAVACSGQTWKFVGTEPKPANIIGVGGDMSTVNPPALCGAPHSASSAWVMLENSDNNECAYAQVGYLRLQGMNNLKVFAEYSKDCDDFVNKIAFDAAPGNHKYQVHYNRKPIPANRKIHMWMDNVRVAKTNFDPEVVWGNQPWGGQWEAETHDEGDDVPGTLNIPLFFSNMEVRPCKGCAWIQPAGLKVSSSSARYAAQWNIQNQMFQVWTK